MAFNFRDIEHNLCIAMDARMAKILCPEAEQEANAVICYGYVDKQAGLTFEVLCLASYVDGDYTIVNENKTVSMKVRSETYKDTEVFPIKNAAIKKRFEQRINIIEEGYYSRDEAEAAREITCIDEFRHPFFPDDVQAILAAEGLKAESIWVRLERYIGNTNGVEAFAGSLLNAPFDARYNLNCGEEVFIAVVTGNDGKLCFVVPKQNQ